MDIEKIVDQIEDIIEEASAVPFSNKVMVDANELLELTNELRIGLPDEIKQANWIKKERERILSEAQKNADELLGQTEEKLEELIDKDEVTRIANERAKELQRKSEERSIAIKQGTVEYADEVLLKTQSNLKELIDILNKNRRELRED